MIPLRVLGDRVLVEPDVLTNAPQATESGVMVATSLAAAVMGEDASKSFNRGTVVALGTPKHPREAEALEAAELIDLQPDDASPAWAELLRDLVRREPCCKVGDDVLFAYDAGQSITVDGHDYILLHENDLLAIVEPEKELTHG